MKKNNLNFNQILGKLIKDARISKNISIEDLAFYMLHKKDEKNIEINQKLEEANYDIDKSVENSFIRKMIFENIEMENKYKENINKIKYWEEGKGFPDLNEIYKLSEILELNPNELYKYRELGRKNLKGEKSISKWKYNRNRIIEENLDSLRILFPALVLAIIFFLFFSQKGGQLLETIITFFRVIWVGRN